jgi:hypothetical protein
MFEMSLLLKALQAKLSSSGLDWLKVESIAFSSKKKSLTAVFDLDGEASPVTVELDYVLEDDDKIRIRDVRTSKAWMTEAIKLALVKTGQSFPLPKGIKGKLLRVLL